MKNIFKKIIVTLLREESKAILKKYKPKIVAITGTVGKTSTREAVYTALGQFEFVRRSPKNFNTEYGIPLTIIGMGNPGRNALGWFQVLLEGLILVFSPNRYPRWLVLEVGTDQPGDIKEITRWLRPDIVIVTKLSRVPVHVEAFDSVEAVFAEKGNLVKALKSDGTLILNADDKDVLAYREEFKGNVVFFGQTQDSDVKVENFKTLYDDGKLPTGISFDVLIRGQEHIPLGVTLAGTLGEQHSSHILAALAVVKAAELNLIAATKSFSRFAATAGRMRLIEGKSGSLVIDDTYNSSPIAVEEALKTLKKLKAKRKIAILGDMLELGKYTIEAHKVIGEQAADTVDILVTVGVRSRSTADAAVSSGMKIESVKAFNTSKEAGEYVEGLIKPGDIILVKGSQGVRMEKAVEQIMAHPEDKEKLLVRQDAEWQNK